MSNATEKTNWLEELQRKIFDECVDQSQNLLESINESSLTTEKLQDVPISVIVKTIHENFAKVPYFRINFLEKLYNTLKENSREERLTWLEFKKASSRWFFKFTNLLPEDGNNNVRINHRDVSAENSERNILHSLEDHSYRDTVNDDRISNSINQMDTIVSSFNINSSSIGFGVKDNIIESEETDQIIEDVTEVDLKLHIKRKNKENIHLRDEILRLEEANQLYEDNIKLIQKKLEQATDRCISLQKEYDEQKRILISSEEREQLRIKNLGRLEKTNSTLQKKVEELETNKEKIFTLKIQITEMKKDNLEYKKQISEYKDKYNEKVIALEYLQRKYNELQNKNSELEKSFEKNLQHQQEKIKALQNLNSELQSKMNRSDNSSRLSITPPPYNYLSAHIHSTPYSNNKKISTKDSLYSELKASGFNLDDVHTQDDNEKISFYEEIANVVKILDEVLQDIAVSRNKIHVPNLQLVKMDIIENLKHQIRILTKLVKPSVNVEESSISKRVGDSREKLDMLLEKKKMNSLTNDRVLVKLAKREKNLVDSVTSTITSILPKATDSTCDKSTSLVMDTINFPKNSEALIASEEEIIVPMAERLNKIIELKGTDKSEDVESVIGPMRNSKQNSIHIFKKNLEWFNPISKTTKYNDLSATKNTEEYLNFETCINEKGDGPHYNIIDMNNFSSLKFQINNTTDKLNSEFIKYDSNKNKMNSKMDMRLVTIRPNDQTYSLSPVISSLEENSKQDQLKFEDIKSEVAYYHTPVHTPKIIPHRKLTVYCRSFDIDSLQTSDSGQNKSGVGVEEKWQCGVTNTPSGTVVAATAVSTTDKEANLCINRGSEKSSNRLLTVERAMSSIEEDSSAESECDVRPLINKVESVPGRRRHNNDMLPQDDKIEAILNANYIDKENNGPKITSNSLTQEEINEDESPKPFPSWTDERLQESGIASFPDIDSEISENLSEDELKKKHLGFSVGLGTDRMTLSRRMILSRRHRDQAEKNFFSEVSKMQQDIKELAPLCVDSESVERVERVKQRLEMVTRCAHRISCNAETLGAVHQERRVSRAVLLADKYLQTLRTKCEKLVVELAETKRILAENNIVLEENLSEIGDDFPRVRYRGVPNNNRTMMARRRASIATISRPLMGSNQDISKEPLRQRNSVSGRVPGLRRPSLCFETPKWEIEKLERTDSSNSITELREIFEQTESRRYSQEENNNLIRTSIKNFSTNTSEYIEGEEFWSNTREDIVSELSHDNEIISLEFGQHYRHPLICWLLNRYMIWKPILWCIFIAFLLGFFINSAVSSNKDIGPPKSWWSIEEMIKPYIEIETGRHSNPKPI